MSLSFSAPMKSRTLKCLVLLLISLPLILFAVEVIEKSQLPLKKISKPHHFRGKLVKMTSKMSKIRGKKTAERRDKEKKNPKEQQNKKQEGKYTSGKLNQLSQICTHLLPKTVRLCFLKVSTYVEGSLFPLLFSKQQFMERISWATDPKIM